MQGITPVLINTIWRKTMSLATIETTASHAEKIDFVAKHLAANNSQFNLIASTCETLAVDHNDFLSTVSEQGLTNLLAKCKALALKAMPQDTVLIEHDKLSKLADLENARFAATVTSFLDANSYNKDKENFKRASIKFNILVSKDYTEQDLANLFNKLKQAITS